MENITDQEFQALKNKIQIVESYMRDLQTIHLNLTGKQHRVDDPVLYMDRKNTIADVVMDLVRMA